MARERGLVAAEAVIRRGSLHFSTSPRRHPILTALSASLRLSSWHRTAPYRTTLPQVGFLDRFLTAMEVHKSRLQLVAMAALTVAGACGEETEVVTGGVWAAPRAPAPLATPRHASPHLTSSRASAIHPSRPPPAAKYEEEEQRVPSTETINGFANNAYPPKMVHQMEVLLLNRCVSRPRWSVWGPSNARGVAHTRHCSSQSLPTPTPFVTLTAGCRGA